MIKIPSKIDQKTVPKMEYILASMFYRFWCQLGSILAPQIDQTPIKNRFQNDVKNGMHFGIDFYPILVDLGNQVGVENHLKSNVRKDQNLECFW